MHKKEKALKTKIAVKVTLFLLLIFFVMSPAKNVYADYLYARGSSDVSTAYTISPGAWYSYQKGDTSDNEVYNYKVLKTPSKRYQARFTLEFPKKDNTLDAGTLCDAVRTFVSIYDMDNTFSRSIESYIKVDNETYKYSTHWFSVNLNEQLVISNEYFKHHNVHAKYRFYVEMHEDKLPDSVEECTEKYTYSRGDTIQNSAPESIDYFRLKTDSNSLYKIVIHTEPVSSYIQKTSSEFSGFSPYLDGNHTILGLGQYFTGYSTSWLEASDAYTDQEGNLIYYIQLLPGKTYMLRTSCKGKYSMSIQDVSLNELSKENNVQITAIKDEDEEALYRMGSVELAEYYYQAKPYEPYAYMFFPIKGDPHPITPLLNADYTLSYKDNIEPGTAYVIVRGKGHVSGEIRVPFQIKTNSSAPAKGRILKDKKTNGKYKVTKQGYSVSYIGPVSQKASVTIPDLITVDDPFNAYDHKQTYKVTAVDANALKKSKKLKTVTIGNNITSIGKNAFRGCKKLKKATLGSGLKKIGTGTFQKCGKLKTIIIKSKLLKKSNVGAKAFTGTPSGATVKVPSASIKAYKKWLVKKGLSKKAKIKKG